MFLMLFYKALESAIVGVFAALVMKWAIWYFGWFKVKVKVKVKDEAESPALAEEVDIKFETETSGGDLPLNRRPTAAEIVKRAIKDNARRSKQQSLKSSCDKFELGPGSKIENSDQDSTEDDIKL